MYHLAPGTSNLRIPSSTFRKEHDDDDDAAARTGPRVSPGTRRGVGKVKTRRPSGRNDGAHGRHRVSASKPTWISPIRQTPTTPNGPTRSTRQATHERVPPRSCHHHRRLTVVIEARPTRTRGSSREQGTTARATTPEERTSTAIGGHRPDAARGAYQALDVRPSPKGAREALVAALQ